MIYFCLYVIALYSASPEANKAMYLLFKSCDRTKSISNGGVLLVQPH